MNDYWAEQEYTCAPPDPVTPPDTERLRRLADAATPGPWEAWQGKAWGEVHSELSIQPVQESWDSDPAHACCEPLEPADAEFIAAAREAVPALLDALAAAEHRATRAEAQSAIRGRAVAIYRGRAREAEAERDWNIRSSRSAKKGRIGANARADRAEAERDEWRQAALDERAAALDLLEQVNVRDVRIRAWEQQYTQDTDSLTREVDEADARIRAAVAILDEDTRWQNEEHLLARVREALTN